jgi:hypothetical protein
MDFSINFSIEDSEMKQGTAALCEPAATEEVTLEHIPAENPPAPEWIQHLVSRMQTIGDQYAGQIYAATKDLIGRVDEAMASPATRKELDGARSEFEGRILEAAGLWSTQRQLLIEEVCSLGCRWDGKLLDTILLTEAALESEELRIQQQVNDPMVEIAGLMRANTAHNEMKAYLEGLKFRLRELPI